jgi:hypothetical protein
LSVSLPFVFVPFALCISHTSAPGLRVLAAVRSLLDYHSMAGIGGVCVCPSSFVSIMSRFSDLFFYSL